MWGWRASISKSLLSWIRSASGEGRRAPRLFPPPPSAPLRSPLGYHEETKRQDPRPHRQHPHLLGGRSGRLPDPGVQAGEESQEEAGRQEARAHAQIQLDQSELRGAGARRFTAQTSQSRGPVEVRRLLLLRHHCDHDHR